MSRENVEVIRRMYERWLRDDPSLFEAFDPEIELHPDPAADWVGVNQRYRGHEGVRQYMAQVYEAFEEYRPEVEELLDAGDKVITLAIEHGRGRGSGAEVQAHRTAHVWTMRAGKAIRLDLYLDREEALKATPGPTAQAGVEIVRRMLDAFNRDDVEAVIAAFDESCEIDEPLEMPDSPATGFRGHDGIRQWMGNLRGVAKARFDARSFTPNGDLLLCELASLGLARGSDLPIEWTTFAVMQIRDGKIGRVRVFLDREDALEAAGLGG